MASFIGHDGWLKLILELTQLLVVKAEGVQMVSFTLISDRLWWDILSGRSIRVIEPMCFSFDII